jgi:hypothetical protein
MKNQLLEPEIQIGLNAIQNRDIFYDLLQPLCITTLSRIASEDFDLIPKFYAVMLQNGDTRWRVSLYTIAIWLINANPELIPGFAEFANIARCEEKPILEDLRISFLSKAGDFEFVRQSVTFPFLRLMEHIVVVDVPHLYEVDALNERTSLCEDLNSFVPIAPIDERLSGNERVRIIRETLENVDLPPFRSWMRMMIQGARFMGDEHSVEKNIDFPRLEGIRLEIPEFVHDEDNGDDEGTVEEKVVTIQRESPMDFVIIGAEPFVPPMEAVNATGQEFFEQIAEDSETL